jgi:CBS domain-containing protein
MKGNGRTSSRARALLAASRAATAKAAAAKAYDPPPEPSELQVHTRYAVDGVTGGEATTTVFCRRRGGSVFVSQCATCDHAAFVPADPLHGDAAVRCNVEKAPAHKHDAAERAMRTYVGEVMNRAVTCVAPDASWEVLEELLLDQDNDALVVTDRLKRPLGIVSKSDLLRYLRNEPAGGPQEADPSPRGFHIETARAVASEIMTPVVHTLFETSPLSFAMAALGQKRVEQALVVRVDGSIVGMISATDAVRWMAEQFGYDCK